MSHGYELIDPNSIEIIVHFGNLISHEFLEVLSKYLRLPIYKYSNRYTEGSNIPLSFFRNGRWDVIVLFIRMLVDRQPVDSLEWIVKYDNLYIYGKFNKKLDIEKYKENANFRYLQ